MFIRLTLDRAVRLAPRRSFTRLSLPQPLSSHGASAAGGPSVDDGKAGPRNSGQDGKRRRHSTGSRRRSAPRLMEPPAEPIGPVVDVHIHKVRAIAQGRGVYDMSV